MRAQRSPASQCQNETKSRRREHLTFMCTYNWSIVSSCFSQNRQTAQTGYSCQSDQSLGEKQRTENMVIFSTEGCTTQQLCWCPWVWHFGKDCHIRSWPSEAAAKIPSTSKGDLERVGAAPLSPSALSEPWLENGIGVGEGYTCISGNHRLFQMGQMLHRMS